jgi:hypothetical protein
MQGKYNKRGSLKDRQETPSAKPRSPEIFPEKTGTCMTSHMTKSFRPSGKEKASDIGSLDPFPQIVRRIPFYTTQNIGHKAPEV